MSMHVVLTALYRQNNVSSWLPLMAYALIQAVDALTFYTYSVEELCMLNVFKRNAKTYVSILGGICTLLVMKKSRVLVLYMIHVQSFAV